MVIVGQQFIMIGDAAEFPAMLLLSLFNCQEVLHLPCVSDTLPITWKYALCKCRL